MTSSSLPSNATHWQNVYLSKSDLETSWFQHEPALSLALIKSFSKTGRRVVDVGGGTSALAGRLIEAGFDVTVLDISAEAIKRAQQRNSQAASRIRWIVADVTSVQDFGQFDVWHDRAVFHFLTDESDRRAYIDLAARSVVTGGHLVIGTFAMDGPEKCSGLPVQRYDESAICAAFHPSFTVVRSLRDMHTTPWGKPQSFFFAILKRTA